MAVYYNGRLTTEETVVKFRYGINGGYSDANHVATITVPAALTAGQFRVIVNGWMTTAINVTDANVGTSIEAALEAITDKDGNSVFAGADVAAGGTDPNYTLTFAAAWGNTPIVIDIVQLEGDTAFVGGDINDIVVGASTNGGGDIEISGSMISINTSETQETVDVTTMGETVRNYSTTVAAGTFDMQVLHAQQNFLALIRKGGTGVLTVYEAGVGAGKPYFRQQILIKQQDVSREAFDKIEVSLSGSFQGAPEVPFGSNQGG